MVPDFIRKTIPGLKVYYKARGWDEAETLLKEIFTLDPEFHLYGSYSSACDCFHSGMLSVVWGDFEAVFDDYKAGKTLTGRHPWKDVGEWNKHMLDLADYIAPFIDDAKNIIEELKTRNKAI